VGEVLDNRRATSALHRPWVVLAGAPGVVLVRGQSEVGLVGGVVPSSWDMEQHGPLEFSFALAISIDVEGKERTRWAGMVVSMRRHGRTWHCTGRSSRSTIWRWWGGRRVSAGWRHVMGASCDLVSNHHSRFTRYITYEGHQAC
jgi:hypothetical protein